METYNGLLVRFVESEPEFFPSESCTWEVIENGNLRVTSPQGVVTFNYNHILSVFEGDVTVPEKEEQ